MPPKRKSQSNSSNSTSAPPSRISSQPLPRPPPPVLPASGRKTRKLCKLESLPDPLLEKIFNEVHGNFAPRTLETLFLSRRLLPFAIRPLYTEIHTYTPHAAVTLFSTLKHRPELAKCTRIFQMSMDGVGENGIQAGRVFEKIPAMSRSARRKEGRMKEAHPLDDILPGSKEVAFDPSRWIFCDLLLKKLFQLLPNLSQLDVFDRSIGAALFRDGSSASCFPALQSFSIILHLTPEYSEPTLSVEEERCVHHDGGVYDELDRSIFTNLSRLPSLTKVSLSGNRELLPFPTASDRSSLTFPRQSWRLKTFDLSEMFIVPDLSVIFNSFTSSLKHLKLDARYFAVTLQHDLLLLPTSITHLSLTFGPNHCGSGEDALLPIPCEFPPVDDALLRLTNLEELSLCGPLISPRFWRSVPHLSKLEHLVLAYHLPLNGTDLLALIRGPNRLTNLRCVCLNICHCPVDQEDLTRKPRWRDSEKHQEVNEGSHEEYTSLSYRDASKIYNALQRGGIHSGGNLGCALRKCDKENPKHRCSRAYAPIPDGFTCESSEETWGK